MEQKKRRAAISHRWLAVQADKKLKLWQLTLKISACGFNSYVLNPSILLSNLALLNLSPTFATFLGLLREQLQQFLPYYANII